MNARDVIQNLGETLGGTANVKSVFGEAIHANGKTVVPVARVKYGFGGGFGSGKNPNNEHQEGEGGGGGGGVKAEPAGVLEITEGGTKFVPFVDMRRMAVIVGTLAVGVALGAIVAGRRRP